MFFDGYRAKEHVIGFRNEVKSEQRVRRKRRAHAQETNIDRAFCNTLIFVLFDDTVITICHPPKPAESS